MISGSPPTPSRSTTRSAGPQRRKPREHRPDRPAAPPRPPQFRGGARRSHRARHQEPLGGPADARARRPYRALEDRARRSLERRLGRSRIGRVKPMADFDWTWPERIGRESVEAALRLDFLDKAQNIVLVANQGLGKTMIDSVRLRSTWRFRRERPAWLNRPLLYPLEPRHPPGDSSRADAPCPDHRTGAISLGVISG